MCIRDRCVCVCKDIFVKTNIIYLSLEIINNNNVIRYTYKIKSVTNYTIWLWTVCNLSIEIKRKNSVSKYTVFVTEQLVSYKSKCVHTKNYILNITKHG